MKKLIIFDYDGVIVDSFPSLHKVYQGICKELKKSCPESLEEFQKTYGENSAECHKNLGFTGSEILIGNKIYKEEIVKKDVQPFKGIIETIKELSKSYEMVAISSAPDTVIKTELEKFGISKYFKEITGRRIIGTMRREKSEEIKLAVKKYSTPENTISIGDRNIDFIEGTKAGLKNIILVDYGWGYNKESISEYNQKFIIKTPLELIEAINNSFQK